MLFRSPFTLYGQDQPIYQNWRPMAEVASVESLMGNLGFNWSSQLVTIQTGVPDHFITQSKSLSLCSVTSQLFDGTFKFEFLPDLFNFKFSTLFSDTAMNIEVSKLFNETQPSASISFDLTEHIMAALPDTFNPPH